MGIFQQYILRIVSVSLLCHGILQITSSCTVRKSLKQLTGVIMLMTIFCPLRDFHFEDIGWDYNYVEDGNNFSSYGLELSKNARVDFIIDECESYIIKKAGIFDLEILVDVTIDDNLIPVFVTIQSNASPHVQKELSNIIERDLGILKENQMWTG